MACKRKNLENSDQVPGKSPRKSCQPCSTKDVSNVADVFCEDCGEYQCNECSKNHQHFSVMAKHKLIPAADAGYVQVKYDMKGLDKCAQHRKTLKFLCEDENKLCCSTCAIVNHRKCHSVVEIEEKTKVEDSGLTSLKKDLCDVDSKTWDFHKCILEARDRLEIDEAKILNAIKAMQDKVNRLFKDLKTDVSRGIHAFKDQAMKKLCATETSSGNIAGEVKLYLSEIEDVSQQGTLAQQLIMSHHLKDQVRQLQQKIKRETEEFKDIEMTFKFDDVLTLPPKEMVMPGKLTMGYVTDSDSQNYSEKKQHTNQKVSLKLLASIDLQQGDDEEEPLYSGLEFLPDGRLVAVDTCNKKCLVYDYNLRVLGSRKLSFEPFGLVSASDNILVVTTGQAQTINFIKIKENNRITKGRCICVDKNLDTISCLDHGNFLVGTFGDQQPVRVVSSTGKEKDLGINFPRKLYPLDGSSCAYIKNCNKVVLTDKYAHVVYIYDIASNTKVEVFDKTVINEPSGVTVGPNDCIFVCSEMTDSIVQISHTGQILSSHQLDMKIPCTVCVSADNTKLAVSNNSDDECKLQLFTIEVQ